MAIQIINNKANTVIDTRQVFHTSPLAGTGTTIVSFTAANNSTVNASYTAYITGSLVNDQPIIPFKIVVWGENDLGIGLVNQVIPPGGTLTMESSAINSIYFSVSATESA